MRTISCLSWFLLAASVAPGQGPIGNLTGKVVDVTGAGIPARIRLTAESGIQEKIGGAADAWGEFSFTGLRATTYTVECSLPGFRSMTVKGVIVENQSTKNLRPLTLQIGQSDCAGPKHVDYFRILEGQETLGSIIGRVQVDEGPMKGVTPPIAGAIVKLRCAKGGYCGETRTNPEGEFVFSGIVPGNATLEIAAKGYYPIEEVGLSVEARWERSYYPFYLNRCLNKSCAPVKPKKWQVIVCQ